MPKKMNEHITQASSHLSLMIFVVCCCNIPSVVCARNSHSLVSSHAAVCYSSLAESLARALDALCSVTPQNVCVERDVCAREFDQSTVVFVAPQ